MIKEKSEKETIPVDLKSKNLNAFATFLNLSSIFLLIK